MPFELGTMVANGETRQVRLPCSVAEFVQSVGWRVTQVVVEHNGRVLRREHLAEVRLKDGDRLEIIVPVAGG